MNAQRVRRKVPPELMPIPVLQPEEVDCRVRWLDAEDQHRGWCSDSDPEELIPTNGEDDAA